MDIKTIELRKREIFSAFIVWFCVTLSWSIVPFWPIASSWFSPVLLYLIITLIFLSDKFFAGFKNSCLTGYAWVHIYWFWEAYWQWPSYFAWSLLGYFWQVLLEEKFRFVIFCYTFKSCWLLLLQGVPSILVREHILRKWYRLGFLQLMSWTQLLGDKKFRFSQLLVSRIMKLQPRSVVRLVWWSDWRNLTIFLRYIIGVLCSWERWYRNLLVQLMFLFSI